MTDTTYKALTERPLQILEVFNEFFGEDRVDLQGMPSPTDVQDFSKMFILVHFPRVKVTNEHDRFTLINHLYAKVEISCDGTLKSKFSLNRAEYTKLHFSNGYMHSHVSSIPLDDLTRFQVPCTGSGPINNTICSLLHDFDIDIWKLFCLELDRFVQVESLIGVPYHKLEELLSEHAYYSEYFCTIMNTNTLPQYIIRGTLTYPQIADFIKFVIDHNQLKFNYAGNKYQIAMSKEQYIITISNLFVKWYNLNYKRGVVGKNLNGLVSSNVLYRCKYHNGRLLQERYGYSYNDYSRYIGKTICTFKGKEVKLTIPDVSESEPEDMYIVYVLNNNIANYVITKILNVINYRYGNKSENSTGKRVYYL